MEEERIYKIEIELAKIKNGWRGSSRIQGMTRDFYVVKATATDVLDSLMVELKSVLGSVLDSKVEIDKESGKSNLKGKNYKALLKGKNYEVLVKREAISFKE